MTTHEGAEQPEERRMTGRASNRQVTKHSTEEQGQARSHQTARRKPTRQEGTGQQGVHQMAMKMPD